VVVGVPKVSHQKNEGCSEEINKGDARRTWEGSSRNEISKRKTCLKLGG